MKDRHTSVMTLKDNIDLVGSDNIHKMMSWFFNKTTWIKWNISRVSEDSIDIDDLYKNNLKSANASAQHLTRKGQRSERKKNVAKC